MKPEFSKFFVASLKRTAQNVSPLVRRKHKLLAEIEERNEELKLIQTQIDTYEAPIKAVTGGYGTEDLVVRTVEMSDKEDKDGKPIKVTKWSLKYPETIIPPTAAPQETVVEDIEDVNEENVNFSPTSDFPQAPEENQSTNPFNTTE